MERPQPMAPRHPPPLLLAVLLPWLQLLQLAQPPPFWRSYLRYSPRENSQIFNNNNLNAFRL
jgi:hypothetical protein